MVTDRLRYGQTDRHLVTAVGLYRTIHCVAAQIKIDNSGLHYRKDELM